jgi:hypothetical protein
VSLQLREGIVTKNILIALAVLAVATSAASAKHHTHHATKPKAAAAAPPPSGLSPHIGQADTDHAMYMKNKHDAGMK